MLLLCWCTVVLNSKVWQVFCHKQYWAHCNFYLMTAPDESHQNHDLLVWICVAHFIAVHPVLVKIFHSTDKVIDSSSGNYDCTKFHGRPWALAYFSLISEPQSSEFIKSELMVWNQFGILIPCLHTHWPVDSTHPLFSRGKQLLFTPAGMPIVWNRCWAEKKTLVELETNPSNLSLSLYFIQKTF